MATEERINRIEEVLKKRQLDLTTVFENIHDPHNMMACLRSCDAIGVYEVSVITTIPSRKKALKVGHASSSSAKKWVEQNKFTSVKDCYDKLRKEGKKIYTTHLSTDAVSLYDLDLTQPIALVFGNENTGVSEEAVSLADGNFIIPQVGMIQSLNISVACAVTMYEVYRQRMIKGFYDNLRMSDEEYKSISEHWINTK